MLADGIYDVFVIDATVDGAGPERVVHLELTIIAGDLKGDVIALSSKGLSGEEFDLIGMPATLTVANSIPTVAFDT